MNDRIQWRRTIFVVDKYFVIVVAKYILILYLILLGLYWNSFFCLYIETIYNIVIENLYINLWILTLITRDILYLLSKNSYSLIPNSILGLICHFFISSYFEKNSDDKMTSNGVVSFCSFLWVPPSLPRVNLSSPELHVSTYRPSHLQFTSPSATPPFFRCTRSHLGSHLTIILSQTVHEMTKTPSSLTRHVITGKP